MAFLSCSAFGTGLQGGALASQAWDLEDNEELTSTQILMTSGESDCNSISLYWG